MLGTVLETASAGYMVGYAAGTLLGLYAWYRLGKFALAKYRA
jgi:hypothetical protein